MMFSMAKHEGTDEQLPSLRSRDCTRGLGIQLPESKKSKQQLLLALFYQISFAVAIGRCKLRKYKYRCIKREMQFFLSSVYCARHVYVFSINQLLSNGVGVNNVSGRTWGP